MSSNMGVVKPKITRPGYFRVQWESQGYACRDEHGSLLVVPVGETRCSLGYCAACPWQPGEKGCLFAPGYARVKISKPPKPGVRTKEQRRAESRAAIARKRAKGLASNGQPLRQSCWNCTGVRCANGTGKYVCVHAPEEVSVSVHTMRNRRRQAEECDKFEWRLVVEIAEVEVGDG